MTGGSTLGTLARIALRSQPDSRLVALTREGSDAAFGEVVGRYQARLVGFAAGIVQHDRAEDVVQESLMKALASIRETHAEINLRPWLYTIVRNRALNNLRDELPYEHLDEEYDGAPQPPDVAARREEVASVVGQLKDLPEAQGRALVQRELEGRSHEEIAAGLGVTPAAVRGLIFRARSSLRNVAGVLIPMPVLRVIAGGSAGGTAATVAAASGGGGGLVKLGVTVGVAVVAIGSGAALHDREASGGDSSSAPPAVKEVADSAAGTANARSGLVTPAGAVATTDGRSTIDQSGRGGSGAGSGQQGSSGSNGTSGQGGSTGPSPASGSSGSGSSSGSGASDGGDHGGSSGGHESGGGGTGSGPGSGGDGGDGGHSGPGGGGLPSGGGQHDGPGDGSGGGPGGSDGGGTPATPDGSGDGSGSGSDGGGALPPPPDVSGDGSGSGGGGSGSGSGGGWTLPPSD